MSNETSATAGDLGCCSGGRDSCLCSCISRAANVARVPVGPAHGSGRLRHWRALGPWKATKGGLKRDSTPTAQPKCCLVDSCSVARNFRNILENIEKDFIRQIVPWTHTHAAEDIRSIVVSGKLTTIYRNRRAPARRVSCLCVRAIKPPPLHSLRHIA